MKPHSQLAEWMLLGISIFIILMALSLLNGCHRETKIIEVEVPAACPSPTPFEIEKVIKPYIIDVLNCQDSLRIAESDIENCKSTSDDWQEKYYEETGKNNSSYQSE